MKAITFNPSSDAFALAEVPIPVPGPEDVLIRVEACGLNPVDAKIIYWKGMVPEMGSNWVPGLDVSGRIEALGQNVSNWKVGDRVLYHGNMFRPHGGFAEYAIHRAATLVSHPDLPSTDAAATPCAGWTAWRALKDKLKITPKDTILIGGGSGGVGGFAVQIAKEFGLSTIIATSSAKNHNYVKQFGATHLIDYHNVDIVSKVMEITDNCGVSHALDTIGANSDIPIANSLSFEGEMVEIVTVVQPERYDNSFAKGLTFHQLALGGAHARTDTEHLILQAGIGFTKLLEQKRIKIPEKRVISMDEVPTVLPDILKGRTVGKIVMKI